MSMLYDKVMLILEIAIKPLVQKSNECYWLVLIENKDEIQDWEVNSLEQIWWYWVITSFYYDELL